MLGGECYCGAIRYEADAKPAQEVACHCSICRRTSASAFVAWLTVPTQSFRFVSGKPTSFKSSSTRTPGEIDVTTCSLEDPEQVPPKDHIFVSSRLSWVKLADGLPAYPASKSG